MGGRHDLDTRKPVLSGGIGAAGPPLKPIALRCVLEVRDALPAVPIVGCGGVSTGADVVEYLMAGAGAVAIGTANLAEPAAGRRILAELEGWSRRHGVASVGELVGNDAVTLSALPFAPGGEEAGDADRHDSGQRGACDQPRGLRLDRPSVQLRWAARRWHRDAPPAARRWHV